MSAGAAPGGGFVLSAHLPLGGELRQLRDEGLLDFRRGRGVTVSSAPHQGAVVAEARELVRFARRHGYRVDELVQIIQSVS